VMVPPRLFRKGRLRGELHLGGDWKVWKSDLTREAYDLICYGKGSAAMQIKRHLLTPSSDKPVLFVGPWLGEFGWELARWQGGIRNVVMRTGVRDRYRVIVMGDPGHEVLYEYADEYWDMPPFFWCAQFERRCVSVYGEGGEEGADLLVIYLRALAFAVYKALRGVGTVDRVLRARPYRDQIEQLHIRLGQEEERDGTFCLFPRTRQLNSHKNWPYENWQGLAWDLVKEYGLFPVVLLETTPLKESIQYLCRASFAVCPESGAIFLSLLTGTPTLAFGHERERDRVTVNENYLGTPVSYVSRQDYDHTVKEIFDGAARLKFLPHSRAAV